MQIKSKKFIIPAAVFVTAVLVAGVFFYLNQSQIKLLSAKTVGDMVMNYIKANVSGGETASLISIVQDGDIYKMKLNINGQEYESFASRDGKLLFPSGYSLAPATSTSGNSVTTEIVKSDKPDVKLFVMSYCPYGLQMEKGILPVAELLGSKINFQLKFVDYAMHGDKEIDENLRQYCIQKNAPGKLSAYLECFTKQGDANACLTAAKIDSSVLATCVSQTDAQFKIKVKAADKSQWRTDQFPPFDIDQADNAKYGVQGSPTLVINGTSVQAARDPQSLLTLICSGFNNPPSECQQKLATDAPAAGFGEGTGSAATAQCGN